MNKIEKQTGNFRVSQIPIINEFKIPKIKAGFIKKLIYITIFVTVLSIGLPNWIILIKTEEIISSLQSEIRKADVGIILGASVYKEQVSPILRDRIITAVELYQRGKVKKLLVSGDHGQRYYNEVNAINYWLRNYGIPDRDIITDHSGFSTYESIYRAQKIYHIRNAVIITQKFHLPRAVYIALNMGISAQGLGADRRVYKRMVWYTFREYLARVKDFFKLHLPLS